MKAAAEADKQPEEPDVDDLAELAEWSAEKTARGHLDRSHVLGLVELVAHQSAFYRSWPTAAGEIIARHLEGLALKIRMTDATTPEEFDAREGVSDCLSLGQGDPTLQERRRGIRGGRAGRACHARLGRLWRAA